MRNTCLIAGVLAVAMFAVLIAAVPSTLNDFFMPGSQPGKAGQLETPDKCDNCHGGYNLAVEPAYNWRGSMMSQAARDPYFYASMAIANQDAPESGDLCIRCHSPAGWLEGRSVPTDGTALNLNDRQGVQCDYCHKLVKPTPLGTNPYPGDATYTSETYPQDQAYLATLAEIPPTSANGMYVADASNAKRGPFVDPVARHQFYYSPFHKDAALCGTCHDVSNPAFVRGADDTYSPNAFDQPSPSFEPYTMFPIERTYSEWLMSAYNSPAGVYAPQFGGNKAYVSTCQDCHMKDVTGTGCNKSGAPVRTDLPLHDMTGGNTFVPKILNAIWPGEVNQSALNAGVQRAIAMLQKAATLDLTVTPVPGGYSAHVRVTNETGHKLPSGYPEGRRIWINVKVYDTTATLVYESGTYDNATGVLGHDAAVKIYEIEPGLSADLSAALGYPAGPSFHFVLNNQIYSDNRIPPRGFTNAAFTAIQSPPVGYSYADGQYWDDTYYSLAESAARVDVTLYYQTTSKEFVEFLRDENHTNDWGQRLYDLWNTNGKSAPVAMSTRSVILKTIRDTQPPTNPSTLTATALSSSQIALAWQGSTDNVRVAGYNIYRNGTRVNATTSTTFTDAGLRAATTYSYYVTAYDEAGNESGPSNTATATTRSKGGKNQTALAGIRAYPNPFNPTVSISYSLPKSGEVVIEAFNILGQRVAELVNEMQPAGDHVVSWDASHLASGVYLIRITTAESTGSLKVNLLK
ncbi:MAG: T9SS type A sorting domain-containing protein [Candidatus Zixiibacteriota bacterium]